MHSPINVSLTRLRHYYYINSPLNPGFEALSAPACQEAYCTAGPANTTTMQSFPLWEAIQQAMDSSEYPSKADFWPEGSLRQVITWNDVSTELYSRVATQPPPFVDNELIQFIQQNGTKLLAICLMCRIRQSELEQAMYAFRNYGLYDQSLPVSQHDLTPYAQRLRWNGPDMHNFLQHQWKFVAPKFSMDRCLMPRLPEGTILPFVQLSTGAKGNFGTVYKVRVHSSHLDREDPIHQVGYQFRASQLIIPLLTSLPSPFLHLFLCTSHAPDPHRQLTPDLALLRPAAMSLLRKSSSRAKITRICQKLPSLAVKKELCWP